MRILVNGAAGFIGLHLCELLIKQGHSVNGLDSINDYYHVNLKYARLKQLGIENEGELDFNILVRSSKYVYFSFIRAHLGDRQVLNRIFEESQFDVDCNLAAQARVPYSLENPEAYIDSKVVGIINKLKTYKEKFFCSKRKNSYSSFLTLNKPPLSRISEPS
jgi:UDP-glucuronate 4-epimerase